MPVSPCLFFYKFCEFFGIYYTIGIPPNVVFRRRTAALQRLLARRYRRAHLPWGI
jgi:hypothetical protein